MPRGLPTEPIPKLNDPSFEDELRGMADWLDATTVSEVAGIPVIGRTLHPMICKRIAGWLRSYANERDAAA